MFNEYMNELLYAAELVGYTCTINHVIFGLSLSINGYNDKILYLWKTLNENFLTFPFDDKIFQLVFERMKKIYDNHVSADLSTQLYYQINLLNDKFSLPIENIIEIMSKITINDLKDVRENVFKYNTSNMGLCQYIGYIHGNISESDAISFKNIYDSFLGNSSNHKPTTNIDLRESLSFTFRNILNYDNLSYIPFKKENIGVNNIVGLYYDLKNEMNESFLNEDTNNHDIINKIYLQIFKIYISEPFFDSLRTKQQLGYIVYADSIINDFFRQSKHGFIFVVETSGKDTNHVILKIKEFVSNISTICNDAKKFDEILDSYYTALNEPFRTIYQKSNYYSAEISSLKKNHKFNNYHDKLYLIKNGFITHQDFIKFIKKHICDNNNCFTVCIE